MVLVHQVQQYVSTSFLLSCSVRLLLCEYCSSVNLNSKAKTLFTYYLFTAYLTSSFYRSSTFYVHLQKGNQKSVV